VLLKFRSKDTQKKSSPIQQPDNAHRRDPVLPVPRSQESKKNISSGFLPLTSPGQAFLKETGVKP
jgi:hypothetical protein